MNPSVKANKHFNPLIIIKKIWDEFVYGSHLLALGDSLAIVSLSIILGIKISWALPLVVYMSVLAINSYNRYQEFDQDILTNPERTASTRKYIKLFPILITFLLVSSAVIVLLTATKQALFFMFLLFLLGMLYTLIFKGWTRNLVGFKNFSIALPYSLMVIFMAYYYDYQITTAILLVAIFYYARIFMSAMYFDIKDIAGDKKEGLKTFAVVMGRNKTMKALLVINVLSFIPIIVGIYMGIIPIYALGLLLTIPYSIFYIKMVDSNRVNGAFLNNVIADGEFIFWLPYILIARMVCI